MRVLLVDIDSLRPDHLGCYGYGRDVSPTIDAVAKDGVRFDECYVSDSPCLPSRTALATCRFGIDSGVVTHYGEGQWYENPGSGHDPDPDRVMSFHHLAKNGIRTTSVSSFAERHMAYHFSGAFQEAIQPTVQTGLLAVEDGAEVTETAIDWLDSHAAEDDWLLHVNYWDVHHPYQEIESHLERVKQSGSAASWPDQETIDDHQAVTGPRTAGLWPNPAEYGEEWYEEKYDDHPMPDHITTRADAARIIDGYDAAIRKVDSQVARLLATLEAEGIREETVVIVTGDHGEALGEHGIYADHAFPHRATQRVPLIVSWPGVTDPVAGTAVDEFVYQFDLVPTICGLLDIETPTGWDAEPFTPALRGQDFSGREQIVSSHGIYTYGRAIYRDEWTYIRLFHPGVFSYPGMYNDPDLPNRGLELLHERSSDPHSTENLIDSRPEKAAELRNALNQWMLERTAIEWYDREPASTRGRDPLIEMVSTGPYLYVDPDELIALFQRLDSPAEKIDRLRRTLREYPRSE